MHKEFWQQLWEFKSPPGHSDLQRHLRSDLNGMRRTHVLERSDEKESPLLLALLDCSVQMNSYCHCGLAGGPTSHSIAAQAFFWQTVKESQPRYPTPPKKKDIVLREQQDRPLYTHVAIVITDSDSRTSPLERMRAPRSYIHDRHRRVCVLIVSSS